MNKTVNLNSLKSEKYIDLSTNLNELLFAYWNLLKSESENDSAEYLSLIYELKTFLSKMTRLTLVAIMILRKKN